MNITGWNINCKNGVWDVGEWFENYDYHVCKNWFGWWGGTCPPDFGRSKCLGSINTTLQGMAIWVIKFPREGDKKR